jgi:hypothetical protein
MDMNEADILAGRAKSVSARHYALYAGEAIISRNYVNGYVALLQFLYNKCDSVTFYYKSGRSLYMPNTLRL